MRDGHCVMLKKNDKKKKQSQKEKKTEETGEVFVERER